MFIYAEEIPDLSLGTIYKKITKVIIENLITYPRLTIRTQLIVK